MEFRVEKRRVLIVDDSAVIRRILTDILSADPTIEVVGAAPNGRIALQMIAQLKPDIVTLDIEMPEMDGIETLREVRRSNPQLPVIMFSSLTERGALSTIEALSAGASDYVTKPASIGSVAGARERIALELLTKIKGLTARRDKSLPHSATNPRLVQGGIKEMRGVDAVLIGVSTGGPNALAEVVPQLPSNLPVPVLITQHMPPLFTRMLAERLSEHSHLKVHEATDGMPITAGSGYLAPGDFHLELRRHGLTLEAALSKAPPENSCRPAVDVMMRSAVALFGGRLLAVIMTGMGQDGLRGCQAVKEAGGQVIVQDQASSVVWGMPGAVANAGLADAVLPLSEIASEIVWRLQCPSAALRRTQ